MNTKFFPNRRSRKFENFFSGSSALSCAEPQCQFINSKFTFYKTKINSNIVNYYLLYWNKYYINNIWNKSMKISGDIPTPQSKATALQKYNSSNIFKALCAKLAQNLSEVHKNKSSIFVHTPDATLRVCRLSPIYLKKVHIYLSHFFSNMYTYLYT